ncbi:MAG: carbohydrate kinase family protein [Anaerolineaceae bacterium]|nr:carbohydrate kinase family protein [Anaerolineaceae bacterium]
MLQETSGKTLVDRPVLVVGAAGMDTVGMLDEAPHLRASNSARVRLSFGGVARNIAENLACLGQPVQLLTAVGADRSGRQLLYHTGDCGVDVSACITVDDAATASYLAIYDADGNLHMALEDMRVLKALTSAVLKEREELFRACGLVVVDANLSPTALRTVFSLARKAGVPVCADTASKSLAARMIPFLPRLFLLTANSTEASVLAPTQAPVSGPQTALKTARWLVSQGVQTAVIPISAAGVCYATPETSGRVPAIRTRVVDPTGAGDALTAAVIFGLLNDISIDEAVRLGVSAASLVLRHPGAVLPELSLEKLYDNLVI